VNDPLHNLAEQTAAHARAVADLPLTDPDLEWLDQRIREVEDGPHTYQMGCDADAIARRNEYLRRLRRIRARLTEGELR
jgi:hypothetical protein